MKLVSLWWDGGGGVVGWCHPLKLEVSLNFMTCSSNSDSWKRAFEGLCLLVNRDNGLNAPCVQFIIRPDYVTATPPLHSHACFNRHVNLLCYTWSSLFDLTVYPPPMHVSSCHFCFPFRAPFCFQMYLSEPTSLFCIMSLMKVDV